MPGKFFSERWIRAGLPFLGLALTSAMLLANGVFYTEFARELFIPVEGVIHIGAGQWPHTGFHTPVGALYYVVHWLPTLVFPLSARTIIHADMIAAVVAAALVIWGARERLPAWAGALCAFYVGLVAMSPRQIGESLATISNNASYNRWGWALTCVVAMIVAIPPMSGDRRRTPIEGGVLGVVIALLFFTKLSYFGAGLGLLLVAGVTVRRAQAVPLLGSALVVLVAIVCLVQLTTGLVGAYLADIRFAASAQPSLMRAPAAYRLAVAFAPGAIFAVVMPVLALGMPSRLTAYVPPVLMTAAIVAAGVGIAVQNHLELENPLLPIAMLTGWFSVRGMGPSGGPTPGRAGDLVASIAILGIFAIPLVQDTGASVYAMVAPASRGSEVAWLAKTPFRDLRIIPGQPGARFSENRQVQNDEGFFGLFGDGARLLDRHLHGRRDVTVLPFLMTNPYPALLGTRPVPHELAWWDAQRTFNAQRTPDPAMLDRVDYVLIPDASYGFSEATTMAEAYGATLRRSFRVIDRTPVWTLLARADCPAGVSCRR